MKTAKLIIGIISIVLTFLVLFQSCAAAAAVFPALHAQLSFASFVFSLVWYFFLCRILFNIIGSYREVTGAGL